MNQDQARLLAEEVELPKLPPVKLFTFDRVEAIRREAIAAALVKLTEGQEPAAVVCIDAAKPFQTAVLPNGTVLPWRQREEQKIILALRDLPLGTALYTRPIPSQQEDLPECKHNAHGWETQEERKPLPVTCNCLAHVPYETTGGWYCPLHGHKN